MLPPSSQRGEWIWETSSKIKVTGRNSSSKIKATGRNSSNKIKATGKDSSSRISRDSAAVNNPVAAKRTATSASKETNGASVRAGECVGSHHLGKRSRSHHLGKRSRCHRMLPWTRASSNPMNT